MDVHLIDGTYELFRHYYALPSARDRDGREVAGVRGVLASILGMIDRGATHVGVATDHVIESFRNRLWTGYKTGAGIEPDLLDQFQLLEDALSAMGVAVWPMVEYEADDALASAAAAAARDTRVDRVIICTPDKDLAQCVRGTRIVQLNRRTRNIRDEAGVVEKFGVPPVSIPDYLALVGDAADGYPGLPGWGAKSAAAILARYGHLESIPVRLAHVARERFPPRRPRGHAGSRARPCLSVSRPRDASHRPVIVRLGRRSAVERPDACIRGVARPARRRGGRHVPRRAKAFRPERGVDLRSCRRGLSAWAVLVDGHRPRTEVALEEAHDQQGHRLRYTDAPRGHAQDAACLPRFPRHIPRTANSSSSAPAPAEARWPPGWLKPGGA